MHDDPLGFDYIWESCELTAGSCDRGDRLHQCWLRRDDTNDRKKGM